MKAHSYAAVCAGAALLLTLGAAAETDGWKTIDVERGITVSKKEQPGAHIPAFRGEGGLNGNVLQMLSLMLDIQAVPRWAFGIDEAKVLSRKDERTDYVYLYSDVPWPVRDRDMIVRRDILVTEQGSRFRIHLQCEPERAPERKGVVRVRTCESDFELTKHDLTHTSLRYTMTLDPAGHLPKWAGSWIAKHVPFRTLEAVERETTETTNKNTYAASVRRWSAAM